MADIRTVAELVTQGAKQFVQDYTSAQEAVGALTTKLEESNRVRTGQLQQNIEAIRATVQKLGQDGAQGVTELNTALDQLTTKLEAVSRIRTPQLAGDLKAVADALKASQAQTLSGVVGVAQNLASIQGTNVARFADTSLASQQAQALAQAQSQAIPPTESLTKAMTQQQLAVAQAAAQFTVQRNALAAQQAAQQATTATVGATTRALTQEQLAVAQAAAQFTAQRNAIVAQQAAAATLQGRLQALLQTVQGLVQGNRQLTTSTTQTTQALTQQSAATGRSQASGVSYLSVLSAIHAASFLATNRTFTLAGSFITLGLAAGKLGVGFGVAGLAIGGLLAIFGAVNNAAQLLQQTLLGTAQALVTVAGVAGAAVVAAGAAGVKIAADAETQLAGLRAFGGATAEQLQRASDQAGQLALQFGVAAKDVLQATSLFVRAGKTIEEALDGGTEAIIKLVVASQGEIGAAQAALAVAQGLNVFNLAGAEASRVADAIAGAVQGSALSFAGFTQALTQAAPGAAALGLSIEDVSAAVALLGNELLKGTISGTAFKQFILDVVNPTKKAQDELAKYGISLKDSSGNSLDFFAAVTELNRGLGDAAVQSGKVTETQRAQALAIAFGSRAFLAANILTVEGTKGLEKFRVALEGVTATNIADILLLPLNKQLEILQVTIQEVGRAFGGPLLGPIRAVAASAIELFRGIIPLAQLAGQAISVVLVGQGFEALQTKITDLVGNNALSSFLIELVNSFRNVADVVQNAIIPAISAVIGSFTDAADETSKLEVIGTTFDSINAAIQRAGAVIAVAIVRIGALAKEFITGEGAGGRLRDTIVNLVTVIATKLLVSLATTGVFVVIAVKALERIGTVIKQVVLPNLSSLADGLIKLGEIADILVTTLTLPFTAAARASAFAGAIIAGSGVGEALEASAKAGDALTETLKANAPLLAGVAIKQIDAAKAIGQTLKGITDAATGGFDTIDSILGQSQGSVRETITVFQDASGAISSALANIIADVERSTNVQLRTAVGQGGVLGVDPEKVKAATTKITELLNDSQRKLEAFATDSGVRVGNIVDKALERIDDIFTKADKNLTKLQRDTQERIDDLFNDIAQRRSDRGATDEFQKNQEDQLRIKQRELDDEARAEDRALEHTRTNRQRDNDDSARLLDQSFQDFERIEQRKQDAVELTLRHTQDARERALKLTQDVEERALQTSLDNEANARRERQQLSEAKTPEDRARVGQQIAQARDDRRFQQGQDEVLRQLRLRQEKQSLALQRSNEVESIAFRQRQEDSFTKFRRDNEVKLLGFRRLAEDQERRDREGEEDTQLRNRFNRETKLIEFRRGQEVKLREFQDKLENESAIRQANKIIREANERATEIATNAKDAAVEVFDTANQQLVEQGQQADKLLEGIRRQFEDLEDSLPADVLANVLAQLNAARGAIVSQGTQLTEQFADKQREALSKLATEIGAREIDLTTRTNVEPTIPNVPTRANQVVTPQQVTLAGTLAVANLLLPPMFTRDVANAFVAGLRLAGQEGLLTQPPIDLQPIIDGLRPPLEGINRFFRP